MSFYYFFVFALLAVAPAAVSPRGGWRISPGTALARVALDDLGSASPSWRRSPAPASAREHHRVTDPRSWLTTVLPAAWMSSKTSKHFCWNARRRPRAPRRAGGRRTAPGSRSRRRVELASRGVVLQLLVDEALELGERDDLVESLLELRFESPSSVPLIRTLSRALSSELKPTPSSMNGDRWPRTSDVALVLPVDAGDDLQQRALPLPFAPTMPKNSPCSTANVTSRARPAARTRCGRRVEEVLLERRAAGAAVGTPSRPREPRRRHTRSAKRGSWRRSRSSPKANVPSATAIGSAACRQRVRRAVTLLPATSG